MNIKDCFALSLKNIKIYKLQTIIFVFVLTLMILIGNIFVNTSFTIDAYFKNFASNSLDSRTRGVHKIIDTNDKVEFISYEDVINDVLEYDHIIYAYNSAYNYVATKISGLNEKYTTYLLPYMSTYPEKITYGRGVELENEIICPRYLKIKENAITRKDLIDMKQYLNKELELNFYQTKINNRYGEQQIIARNSINFRLVGLFDNSLSDDSYEHCYIANDLLKKLYEDTKTVYSEEYLNEVNISEGGRFTEIIIDDSSNMEEVVKDLVKNGYSVTDGYWIDTNYVNMLIIFSYVLLFIAFILIITTIIIYINVIIKKKKIDIALYKTLGYTNKMISKILLFQLIIIIVISFILALIISIIGVEIANNILSFYVYKLLITSL